jgi:hypothetical protein
LERERADLETETRLLNEGLEQESRLRDPASRPAALARLRALFEAWSLRASGEEPSLDRARARRLLGAIAAGAGERAGDEEYRALMQQYRRR